MKHFPKKLWGAALAMLLAVGIALVLGIPLPQKRR